jgi:CarD family transcriptional regulator
MMGQYRSSDSLKQEEVMQFSVGDKVMHPKFGAGHITGEEHRELIEELKHYFVIKLLVQDSTLYVPIHRMDELGMRLVMSRAKLAQVLSALRSAPRMLSKDYKERQEGIREKLGTGRSISIAEAVRDLTCYGQRRRLTQKDEELLNRGRKLLAGEVAVATDVQVFDAQEAISAALEVALASEFINPEQTQEANTVLEPA